MSIHVCKCTHNGREEYHLRYPGMTEAAAQEEYKAREDLLIMHKVTEAETHALGWESSRIKV